MKKCRVALVDADRSAIIGQLEHLANVPPGTLTAALCAAWQHGDEHESVRRIAALRKTYVQIAADSRKAHAKHPQADVPALVDELRHLNKHWTKTRAFREVAAARNKTVETIRNAYYAPSHHRDTVHTES
jgi:type II secretory pathway component PulJ